MQWYSQHTGYCWSALRADMWWLRTSVHQLSIVCLSIVCPLLLSQTNQDRPIRPTMEHYKEVVIADSDATFRSSPKCSLGQGDRLRLASDNFKMAQVERYWQLKVVYGLSNGAIFNDLNWPITQISNGSHCLVLSISEMVEDREVVQWNTNRNLHMPHTMV